MYGLRVDAARLGHGIERVERGVTKVVEKIAVDIVSAGSGDCVYDAAGSVTELRALGGRADLKLLDGIQAVDVRRRGAAAW